MSDGFGTGMAVGMGCGMAVGIGLGRATGSSAVKDQVKAQLQRALDNSKVSIASETGQALSASELFELLDESKA